MKQNITVPNPPDPNDLQAVEQYTRGVNEVLQNLLGEETATSSGAVPVGTILSHGSSTVPDGFLECDGSAVSRTTYSALLAVISTTWGIGDGSSTFNVPDLRAAVLRGAGSHGTETMANGSAYSGGSVGDFNDDAGQAWQLGASADDSGSRDYWGTTSTRNVNADQVGAANRTVSRYGTDLQGGVGMLKAVNDGTYGDPRTGAETKPFTATVMFIIKF